MSVGVGASLLNGQCPVVAPRQGISGRLGQISGSFWIDRDGDHAAGRVVQSGRCLSVGDGDTITCPANTTSISMTSARTSDGLPMVANTDYSLSNNVLTFTTAGKIFDIVTNLDHYPLTEGSGTKIYSVLRASGTATLYGIDWDYTSQYVSYANLYGYHASGSVIVPALYDQSGWADGSLSGYRGRVAYNIKLTQSAVASCPTSGGGALVGATGITWTDTKRCTITCWVARNGSYSAYNGRFGVWDNTTGFGIGAWITSTSVVAAVNSNGISNGAYHWAASVTNANQFDFYAIVIDLDQTDLNLVMKAYKNGSLLTWTTPGTAKPAALNNGYKPTIGRTDMYNYASKFSRLRIYNRALSTSEITSIYYGGLVSTGLTLLWPMVEGGGSVAYDVVGNNHGISTGTAMTWATRDPDFMPYIVQYGGQECAISGSTVWVPRRIDGTYINPAATSTLNHPPILDAAGNVVGINNYPISLCFHPAYDGSHCPAEVSDIYDAVQAAGGGFPFGDTRDVTLTLAAATALQTDAKRRLAYREIDNSSSQAIGVSDLYHYNRQITAGQWRMVRRYLRTKAV